MKKLFLYILMISILTIFSVPAHSTIKKVGQTGLQFLKVDIGARAAAMGGAYNMVGEDATALFYNPAGIGKEQSNFDLFVGRTEWIADITYNALGIVKNLGTWGNVGLSFINVDYGNNILGTQVADNEKGFIETGNLNFGAYAIGLAYARQLTDKFLIGGQIRYAYQHLGKSTLNEGATVKNEVSGLSYDFGTIFYPGFKSFRMGMSINNFSTEFKYQKEGFELPLTFKVSFAMDVLDLIGEHNNSLLISLDAVHPRDYTERIHLGGEYLFMNMFAFRAGYKFNYDEEGLTAGLGFSSDIGGLDLKIDYAYSDLGAFNMVNRFSFGISF
ncbi:MAG: PorV/PorQ family protein [Actinobacteria bacterium]|nr:PorV/PorQ family protein [Actinomycetota bacterium]